MISIISRRPEIPSICSQQREKSAKSMGFSRFDLGDPMD
jgi:hypothetical protein